MPTEKVYKEVKELEPKIDPKTYDPQDKELETRDFIKRRVEAMKDYRSNVNNLEKIWKEADIEYIPKYEDQKNTSQNFITETDESGNSTTRYVTQDLSGDDGWFRKSSEPALFVKVQTAMSIIISRNPEAFFQPTSKKYEATTKIAYSLWETSYLLDNSKDQVELFAFNLCKYGWSPGRTYPLIIKRNKSILKELDTENPENNVYEEKVITDFNGIHRESLDPWKTWIDEMSRPNDHNSTNDWYFEKDYSRDDAMLQFGHFSNWNTIPTKSKKENEADQTDQLDEKNRDDTITIGFYENRNKDLYGIYIPEDEILLYSSPLPNDDGKLSIWHTYWLLRDHRIPYGVGLWEIIKQKKELYDDMQNMTMKQLVLSIMKMFFYTGTNPLVGDGKIKIKAGEGVQNLGGKVDFLEVPGPGKDSFEGLRMVKDGFDEDSGVKDTISGEASGGTLGQDLLSRENLLRRMNTPLNNIARALREEAYIYLSWADQTLSTPEVKEFVDEDELRAYEDETGINLFERVDEEDEEGNQTGITATFFKEVPLMLDGDKDDQLEESKDLRFFKIGKDIKPQQIKWRGIINIEPRSILIPSEELDKQRKAELFNLIIPVLQFPPELYAKPVGELIKTNKEDVEDWLPATWVEFLETGKSAQPQQSIFSPPPGEEGTEQSMKADQGMTAQTAKTVVPSGEVSGTSPQELLGGLQ